MNAVNQEYGYNATDTVNKITDKVYPALSMAPAYDAADRISNSGSSADAQGFYWDPNGNLADHQRAGMAFHGDIAPGSNRLMTWKSVPDARLWRNFDYDAVGNVYREIRNNGTRTYEYDAFFRLGGIKQGGNVLAYYYNNALNQRALKQDAGGATRYQYGPGGELLAEYSGSSHTHYVWLDGELLAIERDGNIYASYNDLTKRPVVLLDAAAKKIWRSANAPFDRTVVDTKIGDMNIGFPGQYYDKESGLWYNWHRYYDASLARYLQSDPTGLSGGPNMYTYANGNPFILIDPYGLDWFRPWSDQTSKYVVGRDESFWIQPGGPISKFVEHCIPAGRTFGEIHDEKVDSLRSKGVPDWKANIPTMPAAYKEAFVREGGNSINNLEKNIINSYMSSQYSIWGIYFEKK